MGPVGSGRPPTTVTKPLSNASAAIPAAGAGRASEIAFDAVTKRYPRRAEPAVSSLSLTVPAGEICVLVGPSGAGKTTAMRMVNRLIDITEGDIRIDGTSVRSLDATRLRRRIGYVIQQVGLFPHMTVALNIGTVPRLLGWDRPHIRARAQELVELVGLDPAQDLDRYPAELSGGQRQRVGLARAMAADPPLMLMDEPFGALDPITRARLQDEFLRLHHAIRKTIIFVTHDIDEAIKMGDRIAILREGGVLAQYAAPDEVLTSPADDFVGRFVGTDRGLKRLSLMALADLELEPAEADAPDRPSALLSTPLRDALAMMLSHGGRPLTVVGDDRRPVGVVSLETMARALSSPVGAGRRAPAA
jgi:osmoprotectant transport system ATP-binding protein